MVWQAQDRVAAAVIPPDRTCGEGGVDSVTNIRQSVLGPIAAQSGQSLSNVDIGTLVRRLILFDRTIVDSVQLREVPILARTFGKAGFVELIDSGLLRFGCGKVFPIVDVERDGIRDLPPNHFSFGIASVTSQEQMFKLGLAGLQGISGLNNSERAVLEDLALESIIPLPDNYGSDLLNQFDSDIRGNIPVLRMAIEECLKTQATSGTPLSELAVEVEETDHRVFHIKASLSAYGIPPEKSHDLLKSSVLAVSNIDKRLADMQAYSAISGFLEQEAALLFGRLAGVMTRQNPSRAEEQFERVIELAELPDFKSGQKVDIQKLLKIRDTAECRAFREWLSTVEDATDAEIKEVVSSLRNKVASLAASPGGKLVRLAATTGIGLIPVIGPITGAVAGAIDSFLVDKVLPQSGIVAFLTDTYPSLFASS